MATSRLSQAFRPVLSNHHPSPTSMEPPPRLNQGSNENVALEFWNVLNTKQQAVEGMIYCITIEPNDGGQKKTYEVKVRIKPWMNFQELQEFKLVDSA